MSLHIFTNVSVVFYVDVAVFVLSSVCGYISSAGSLLLMLQQSIFLVSIETPSLCRNHISKLLL